MAANEELNETGRHRLGTFPNDWRKRTKHKSCCQCIPSLILNHRHPFLSAKFATKTSTTKTITTSSPSSSRKPKRRTRLKQQLPPLNTSNETRCNEKDTTSPAALARRLRLRRGEGEEGEAEETEERAEVCKSRPSRLIRCNCLTYLVIFFYLCLFASPSQLDDRLNGFALLTSANELFSSSEPATQPEAQPLVYMLHAELGSGDGLGGGGASYSRAGSSSSMPNSELGGGGGSPTTGAADVAPALIEARCWNNYENDNDCKQLNVITAPEGERQQIQHQQQQHYNQQQTSNEDDTIITPVVIFEASSTIEPAQDTNSNGDGVGQRGDNELLGGQERPVFMAPPYQSNDATGRRGESRKYNKQQQYDETGTTPQSESSFVASAPTPRTWNVNMNSGGEGVAAPPVTRPSTIHFVVTPRPKSGNRKPVTGKTTKTTTQGRRCRDENDADCDEPEDNQIQPAKSYNSLVPPDQADKDDMDEGGDDDDQDEENNNNNNNDIGSPSSTRPNQVEPGSGGGLGQGDDDNDDSTDDGDDEDSTGGGDSSESSGSNSIQESTSLGPDETTGKDGRLLVITTRYPGNDPHWDRPSYLPPVPKLTTSTTTTTITSSAAATEATSTVVGPSTARRPQPGAAEIEVVVHSTLPPSFPGSGGRTTSSTNSLDEFGVDPTTATTTTTTSTTTTMMPDETYTSRPIFPSSTLASASVSASPSGGGGSGDDQNPNQNPNELPGSSSPNEALQTTTEVDLYTFKPIPIPVEPAEARPRFEPQNSLSTTDSSAQPGDPKQPKPIGSQHIYDPDGVHRRPPSGVGVGNTYDRPPYDDGWTTRKPVVAQHLPGQTQDQIDQIDAWIGSKRLSPSKTYNYMGTDILSTMLLYASIIILVFISLIFVTIAYSFWRRNSLRSRALLAKAQMMNGRPPHGMIESMSHVSHLMHGADGLPPSQPQPPPGTQQGLLSTYAQAKGSSMGKVTTSLVKPMDHQSGGSLGASVDPDEDLEEEEDDMDEQRGEQQTTRHHHHMNQQERSFKDDDSKEQLAADDEGSYLEDHHQNLSHSQQHPQGQHQQQTRAPRLAGGGINDSMRNQSGSWSTEDPTTTSSGSQRTQDSQLQQQQQQQHASSSMQQHNGGQRSHHPYPNSLSDGRQNSSSISDSQCSPDPGPSGNQSMTPLVMQTSQQQQQQPMMMPPNQPSHHMPLNSNIHNHNQQPSPQHLGQVAYAQQQPRQALQPMGARPMFRSTNGAAHMGPMVGPPAPGAPMSPIPRQPFHHPMMMMNGSAGPGGMKHRLVASRSIEDIQPSQHVGFIESNNNSHVPYAPVHQQQQSPHLHLLGGQPGIQARPQYQYPAGAHVAMGAGNSALLQRNNINNNNSMISPQRIAMSPLATLGRRGYPPGAGLNRNIYSEDSSSFMTTSPSLARTSSSSSFAFNMSNLPTPSSIKAKPIVDGSGRIFNDYTAGFNDTNNSGSQCNSNGTSNGNSNGNSTGSAGPPAAGVPPVFGRNDRSEAWYV